MPNSLRYQPTIHQQRFDIGATNPTRHELHFGNRVFRCFQNRPSSFDALLQRAAKEHPQNEALVAGNERLNYAEFDRKVSNVAYNLQQAGIQPGERIGIMVGNSIAFFLAMMGTIRAGAIAVPMGVKMKPVESAYILNQCDAAALITEQAVLERAPEPEQCPTLRQRWICDIENTEPPHAIPFSNLCDLAHPNDFTPHQGHEDDTIMLFYTSGTTGHPKGAEITNINIVHSALHFTYGLDLQPGHRALLAVPGSHISGFVAIFTNMLATTGTVIMMRDYKTADVLQTMKQERISFTVFVPAIYHLILMNEGFEPTAMRHWQIAIYGGGIMPPATVERMLEVLPECRLINAYGATETTSPVSIMPAWESANHPSSVGLLVQCADALVMDENGREVSPGQTGELFIRGPMIVPRYWSAEQKSAESFVNGYWRTGDMVTLDKNGFLYIHDRIKDLINKGGYKVFSAEVENALMAMPGIIECATVPVPDQVMGERVFAFVTINANGPDEAAIRAHANQQVSDYKQPDYYLISEDTLPRNANGKVVKAPLKKRAEALLKPTSS